MREVIIPSMYPFVFPVNTNNADTKRRASVATMSTADKRDARATFNDSVAACGLSSIPNITAIAENPAIGSATTTYIIERIARNFLMYTFTIGRKDKIA